MKERLAMNAKQKKGSTVREEILEFLFIINFIPCTVEAADKILKGVRFFFIKHPEYVDMFDLELFDDLFIIEK